MENYITSIDKIKEIFKDKLFNFNLFLLLNDFVSDYFCTDSNDYAIISDFYENRTDDSSFSYTLCLKTFFDNNAYKITISGLMGKANCEVSYNNNVVLTLKNSIIFIPDIIRELTENKIAFSGKKVDNFILDIESNSVDECLDKYNSIYLNSLYSSLGVHNSSIESKFTNIVEYLDFVDATFNSFAENFKTSPLIKSISVNSDGKPSFEYNEIVLNYVILSYKFLQNTKLIGTKFLTLKEYQKIMDFYNKKIVNFKDSYEKLDAKLAHSISMVCSAFREIVRNVLTKTNLLNIDKNYLILAKFCEQHGWFFGEKFDNYVKEKIAEIPNSFKNVSVIQISTDEYLFFCANEDEARDLYRILNSKSFINSLNVKYNYYIDDPNVIGKPLHNFFDKFPDYLIDMESAGYAYRHMNNSERFYSNLDESMVKMKYETKTDGYKSIILTNLLFSTVKEDSRFEMFLKNAFEFKKSYCDYFKPRDVKKEGINYFVTNMGDVYYPITLPVSYLVKAESFKEFEKYKATIADLKNKVNCMYSLSKASFGFFDPIFNRYFINGENILKIVENKIVLDKTKENVMKFLDLCRENIQNQTFESFINLFSMNGFYLLNKDDEIVDLKAFLEVK